MKRIVGVCLFAMAALNVHGEPKQLLFSEDAHMLPTLNLEVGFLGNYDDGYSNGFGLTPFVQLGLFHRVDIGFKAGFNYFTQVSNSGDLLEEYYIARDYDLDSLDVSSPRLSYIQPFAKVRILDFWDDSSVVAYGNYTIFQGDPIIVNYPEDGRDGRAIGVAALDAEEGREITIGTMAVHTLSDVTNIAAYVHAGVEGTYMLDKEWLEPQRDSAIMLTPIVSPQLVLANQWSLQLENRFEIWLSRGHHYELIPGIRWEPIPGGVAQLGASVPVYGGDVFRLFAGFSYKIGKKDFRIRTHDIYFPPDQAILYGSENERSEENRRHIERLARRLERYPGYDIAVEGHTSKVHWDDPERGEVEQRTELIPLSQARAEAVMGALIDLGIDPVRLTAVGRGGLEPLVPFSEPDEQWRNRRVEFVLTR